MVTQHPQIVASIRGSRRHALCQLLADLLGGSPWATPYNPLVLAGASTLAAQLLEDASRAADDAGRPILVWDGETLSATIAGAVAGEQVHRLRDRLAKARLVLVDGIDRLQRGDVQVVFSRLLDHAAAGGTVFVVTLSAVGILDGLDAALGSRLAAGLVIPLGGRGTAEEATHRTPSLRRVIRVTARHHELTADDLIGPSRRRKITLARSLAMYLARQLTGQSLGAIGRAFGGRDHTTVMHGVRITAARIATEPAVANEIARLAARLAG